MKRLDPFKKIPLSDLKKNRRLGNDKGFSLVELMVVVVIASLMLTAMYGLFITLSRSYTTEEVKADAMQDVRAALNFMIRDIRMAGLDPKRSGDFGIEAAEDYKIRFTLDHNSNGLVDGSPTEEQVTYLLTVPVANSSDLQQILYENLIGQIPSTQPVISNVINRINEPAHVPLLPSPVFTYWDKDGNPIATPVSAANLSNIREVRIRLIVRLPAGKIGSVDRTLESSTQCRNRYF